MSGIQLSDAGLQTSEGGPILLTKQWAAKGFCNLNGGGTIAIRDSGNISGATDSGVGDYTLSFTASMADVNYTFSGNVGTNSTNNNIYAWKPYQESAILVGSIRQIATFQSGVFDPTILCTQLFGDLA